LASKDQKSSKSDPYQKIKMGRPVKDPKPIFTKPRKLHKVFNFSNKLFDNKHNIRTVIKTKEKAFKSRIVTFGVENTKKFRHKTIPRQLTRRNSCKQKDQKRTS
jgi:hypothetical protein